MPAREPSPPPPRDRWETGDAYERYIGRWSRPVAAGFLEWLEAPAHGRWLDVGCGTGALTTAVLAAAEPRAVLGMDPSPGFAAHARRACPRREAGFLVGDARALPLADGTCDAIVSGLVLNFVPEPERALSEMARVARVGGRVGAYVWDYAEGMEYLRRFWDAAVALDPEAAALDEGRRFPICGPGPLERLARSAGLADVRTRAFDVPTRFASFEDLWAPFLGGQGPAPGYVATLDEARRIALRDRLRAGLTTAPDGAIHLVARAWAVRGTR